MLSDYVKRRYEKRIALISPIIDKYGLEAKKLIKILDDFLNSGFKFGTIDQGIESNNFLHISFDDGYKEHLTVAKKIKKEFGLQKNNCSFAINIGNSLLSDFSGMDLIYDIIQNKSLKELCNYLSINLKKCTHKGKIYQNECL